MVMDNSFLPQKPSTMLYRILFAALIAMSASVTSAAPVLDAGDALEARMAKLEATVNAVNEEGVHEEFFKYTCRATNKGVERIVLSPSFARRAACGRGPLGGVGQHAGPPPPRVPSE